MLTDDELLLVRVGVLRTEFELIEQIYYTLSEAGLTKQYGWVKGHQDDTTSVANLSIEA